MILHSNLLESFCKRLQINWMANEKKPHCRESQDCKIVELRKTDI